MIRFGGVPADVKLRVNRQTVECKKIKPSGMQINNECWGKQGSILINLWLGLLEDMLDMEHLQ